MAPSSNRGVELPDGVTGSSFLHQLLQGAAEDFPAAFANVHIPGSSKAFRSTFGDVLTTFEAARASSRERVDIARSMRQAVSRRLRFVDEEGARPFSEALAATAEPIPLERIQTTGPGRLSLAVNAGGARHAGPTLSTWLAAMRAEHKLTEPVERAINRMIARGETISLKGERFVLLGAGAELSPAPLLLAAGAEVLWFDLRGPDSLRMRRDLGGVLYVPQQPTNLLAQPAEIAATIRRFAEDGPVHLGMYAYAGGEGQEWRLTASMNGILSVLPTEQVRSVSMLISPTTVGVTSDEDLAASERRLREAALWKRTIARSGLLKHGHVRHGEVHVARSIVPLQGATYQAAQYVGKILAAEAHSAWGCSLDEPSCPLTFSANVAPITATRSLSHPVFEAGFIGAPKWGIYISEPATTRELHSLLMIHDVTDPEAPGSASLTWAHPSERARALLSQQVHGGVFSQPYDILGSIKVAAVLGFAQKPGLLLKLRQ